MQEERAEGESEAQGEQEEEEKGSVAFISARTEGIYSSAHAQRQRAGRGRTPRNGEERREKTEEETDS